MAHELESFSRQIAAKPPAEQALFIREAMRDLPKEQKTVLAEVLAESVPGPDQVTANRIWLIVIWAVVLVMIAAVLVLGLGVFIAPAASGTTPETMLTVFTTVTAFLAGLLAPSPVKKKADG
jgi:hypothetical protein